MKVSLSWLRELVDLKLTPKELADTLSLKSIGVKTVTDDYIELDLTYNRGDLLSLRGVAKEVAAITQSKIKFGSENEYIWVGKNLPKTKVKVESSNLCPLYCVAKIEYLKVGPSPKELIKKLTDSGFRSINNIADITNLVMLDYGQPLHAFDAAKVEEGTLIVREAKAGEQLTTLDGKTRNLDKEDLLIADTQKPLGLAGVMGGKDSEVSPSTTTILLEAAIFDPVVNRKTDKRHGLFSEANKRFQHGLTKTNLIQVLSATIKMYESLGGKLTAISLVGDLEDKPKIIQLAQQKINSLLGVDISPDVVETSLQSLGFNLRGERTNWEVTVPYFRQDINIEEDLIEEVARMYGYEKIPSKRLEGELPKPIDQSQFEKIEQLKKKLVELGLTEVQTYSFYSTDVLKNTCKDKYLDYFIKIANPISSETQYLRCDLWPNLVEVICKNIRLGFNDVAIFELGKVYLLQYDKTISEKYRLAVALMNGSNNPIAEAYQLISNIMSLSLGSTKPDSYAKDYFHPTRFAFLKKEGKVIGGIAQVHPRIVNRFGVDQKIAVLEIELI